MVTLPSVKFLFSKEYDTFHRKNTSKLWKITKFLPGFHPQNTQPSKITAYYGNTIINEYLDYYSVLMMACFSSCGVADTTTVVGWRLLLLWQLLQQHPLLFQQLLLHYYHCHLMCCYHLCVTVNNGKVLIFNIGSTG